MKPGFKIKIVVFGIYQKVGYSEEGLAAFEFLNNYKKAITSPNIVLI